jgi:DNA-binding GntR family transcriptional regulator
MVEFDDRGRTRVPTLTLDDLREILAVRTAIDPLAARLAAERGDTECLALLDRNVAATAAAATLAELSRLDTEFHGLIVRAAGNRRLQACWNVLEHQVELWITQMQRQREAVSPDTHDKTVTSHQEIFEAIRSGGSDKAETLARRHLSGWAETMPFLR